MELISRKTFFEKHFTLGLIFLILGLQIFFFKILRSEEGKKIKIKKTKKLFFILSETVQTYLDREKTTTKIV